MSSYVNKKHGITISTDDTLADWTLGTDRNARHVHFTSTPVKADVSNINLNVTPPPVPKEDIITESILHNTIQTLGFEFKWSREPKIQNLEEVYHQEPC